MSSILGYILIFSKAITISLIYNLQFLFPDKLITKLIMKSNFTMYSISTFLLELQIIRNYKKTEIYALAFKKIKHWRILFLPKGTKKKVKECISIDNPLIIYHIINMFTFRKLVDLQLKNFNK